MSLCTAPPKRSASLECRPSQQDLWQRYHQQGDAVTENDLVQQYLPLVKAIVGRLAMTLPSHLDPGDLQSAGLVGLLLAMRNFDPRLGVPFESYARLRVRGAIFDELRRMDWVPRSVHERARKLQDTMNQLEQELGQSPSEAQMARALGLSLDEYLRCLDEVRPAAYVCLDTTRGGETGEGALLHEVVPDDTQADPSDVVARRELIDLIKQRLKLLPEIQRKVLALYYEDGLLLREIADTFDLTESRICQIHAQAILAIKSYVARYEAGHVQADPLPSRA
jgi:RNA polymerase sigma factor for flagellar operon FliA